MAGCTGKALTEQRARTKAEGHDTASEPEFYGKGAGLLRISDVSADRERRCPAGNPAV